MNHSVDTVCYGCHRPASEYHTLLCGHSVCTLCREKIITGQEGTTPFEQCYQKDTSTVAVQQISYHELVENFAIAVRSLPPLDDPSFNVVVNTSRDLRHAFLLLQARMLVDHFPIGGNMKARSAFALSCGFVLDATGGVLALSSSGDCVCNQKIRCNTQLNSLVPHDQYLSSVPIDARFDPLQSDSRKIYNRQTPQTQPRERGPSPNPGIHYNSAQSSRPYGALGVPQDLQNRRNIASTPSAGFLAPQSLDDPARLSKLSNVSLQNRPASPIPPIQRYPGSPGPRVPTPGHAAMARASAPDERLPAPHDIPEDYAFPGDHNGVEPRSASQYPSSPLFHEDQIISGGRARQPSVSRMARPAQSKTTTPTKAHTPTKTMPRAADLTPTPQRTRQSGPSTSRVRAGSAVRTNPGNHAVISGISPGLTTQQAGACLADLSDQLRKILHPCDSAMKERLIKKHNVGPRVQAMTSFKIAFEDMLGEAALGANLEGQFDAIKKDMEGLIDALRLDIGPPKLPLPALPSTNGRTPSPNHHLNAAYSHPSSIKATERRLASSESDFSDTRDSISIRQPMSRNHMPSESSWTSDEATDFGMPSSVSTKAGRYVPTYPDEDSYFDGDVDPKAPQPTVTPTAMGFPSSNGVRKPQPKSDGPHYSFPEEHPSRRSRKDLNTPLHVDPRTADPATRRMLRTMNSVDRMNASGGLPHYNYPAARDVRQYGNREPPRDRDGMVARSYGGTMQAGATFDQYNAPDEGHWFSG